MWHFGVNAGSCNYIFYLNHVVLHYSIFALVVFSAVRSVIASVCEILVNGWKNAILHPSVLYSATNNLRLMTGNLYVIMLEHISVNLMRMVTNLGSTPNVWRLTASLSMLGIGIDAVTHTHAHAQALKVRAAFRNGWKWERVCNFTFKGEIIILWL